jgi:hypothetical protein
VFHVLGILTYINLVSVKLFVRVQNVFTVSKLMACLIIVVSGIYMLCAGECWVRTPGLTALETSQQNGACLFPERPIHISERVDNKELSHTLMPKLKVSEENLLTQLPEPEPANKHSGLPLGIVPLRCRWQIGICRE